MLERNADKSWNESITTYNFTYFGLMTYLGSIWFIQQMRRWDEYLEVEEKGREVGTGCEFWQQSIVESTLLLAITEGLAGNTRFSASLFNPLNSKRLTKNEWILRSCFIFPRCETCQTERRYMVFRASRRGLSRCG